MRKSPAIPREGKLSSMLSLALYVMSWSEHPVNTRTIQSNKRKCRNDKRIVMLVSEDFRKINLLHTRLAPRSMPGIRR